MRHAFDAATFRGACDPERLGEPAAARDVRLDHVDMAALDELAETPACGLLLARGDANRDAVGELGVGLEFIRLERLLQPVNPDLLELASDADRAPRIGAITETGIDQNLDTISGRALCRACQAHVVL